MASPAKFVREVKQEAAKVSWPSKKEVTVAGVMVLVVAAVMSAFFFFVDWGVSALIKQLLGL